MRIQLYVPCDYETHYFTIHEDPKFKNDLVRLATFDLLVNNTDRKAGHVLVGKDVIVAKTMIPSGSSISEDLVAKEFRSENVPSDAVVGANNWSFMETNRRLVAGDILRERHLRKSKLVRRKDPVTLIHNSPALEIITTGVALQDGYFGQSVKVLNTESGRNVMGVVTGRGKIVIETER